MPSIPALKRQISEFETILVNRVLEQPGLHRETCLKKTNKETNKNGNREKWETEFNTKFEIEIRLPNRFHMSHVSSVKLRVFPRWSLKIN